MGLCPFKKQDFIDYWRRIINVPKGSATTCESVTSGLYKLMRSLPEGMLKGKRVLVSLGIAFLVAFSFNWLGRENGVYASYGAFK